MEIGRKTISDEDFAKLWGDLYQEFHNLTSSNQCDASVVYNAIYIICTSDSNLEEKLYWKIGDFFYNRCKLHKDCILQSENYLNEYISQFQEYSKLVNSIDTLGSFLNSCVKGRRLNDFGYLLWERMIIQNLNDLFFENVFEYSGDYRLIILYSFERIIPDITQPLLYYKEKYEKVALNKIKRKYKVNEIVNFEEFYNGIKAVTLFESHSMTSTFLPVSYEAVFSVIEECFLSSKYYEILYNLTEYISLNNSANIRKSINKLRESASGLNTLQAEIDQYQVCFIENTVSSDELSKKNSFTYQQVHNDQYESLRNYYESDSIVQKAFSLVQGLVNKRKPLEIVSKEMMLENTISHSINCRNDQASVFPNLLECFGSLNASYSLLKKAYALYVNTMIKSNISVLESSISNILLLFDSLNIFEDNDFHLILLAIFKDYLQRAKPCYMQRLCNFTDSISKESNETQLGNLKPFDSESSTMFKLAVSLVSDKREFLNLYQSTLRDRLLSKTAIPIKEIRILRMLEVPHDDRLHKMINEMDSLESNFKIINSLYWNIEPQFPNLPLPVELLREISLKKPELQVFNSDGKNANTQGYSSKFDLFTPKFRINTVGLESKMITLAHQYSVVQLSINSKLVHLNMYQYVIICLLMKESLSFGEIVERLNEVPENIVRKVVDSLVYNHFIVENCDRYCIDCLNIENGDYSRVHYNSEPEAEICIESYLQTIGVKILKLKKEVEIKTLINEIKHFAKVDASNQTIESSIKKLIEKGLAEHKGDIIEFIP